MPLSDADAYFAALMLMPWLLCYDRGAALCHALRARSLFSFIFSYYFIITCHAIYIIYFIIIFLSRERRRLIRSRLFSD